MNGFLVDIGRKLNVHMTFRRHPERLLNILCTFWRYNFSRKTTFSIVSHFSADNQMNGFLVDIRRKLKVHMTFRRHPQRLMYVQFTYCVYWIIFNEKVCYPKPQNNWISINAIWPSKRDFPLFHWHVLTFSSLLWLVTGCSTFYMQRSHKMFWLTNLL